MAARITSEVELEAAYAALVAGDPRLFAASDAVGPLPLRLIEPGLPGLLRIVVAQQLSIQSAAALWRRVGETLTPLEAARIAAASETEMRAAGLSRQKARTFYAVAEAVAAGLDLAALAEAEPEAARAALEAIPGIGRWTADLFLMFCAGHPDILPVGDLAVRRGAALALGLETPFEADALAAAGAIWSPYRSTAARLFYAYYVHARGAGRAAPPAARGAPNSAAMPL